MYKNLSAMTEEELKYYLLQPCCIDKYLPKSIMLAPRRALTFFTNGDVTMEKFYRAISYLIADPHVMVLTMPNMTHETAAFLSQCFDRKWITDLVLSTNRNVQDLLDKYLPSHKQHILYTADKQVTDTSSHLVLYSDHQSLSITGPMFDTMLKPHQMFYTMLYQPRYDMHSDKPCTSPLLNAILPDNMRHRKVKGILTDQTLSARLANFLRNTLPPYED